MIRGHSKKPMLKIVKEKKVARKTKCVQEEANCSEFRGGKESIREE